MVETRKARADRQKRLKIAQRIARDRPKVKYELKVEDNS
jgi:hypothetical protein